MKRIPSRRRASAAGFVFAVSHLLVVFVPACSEDGAPPRTPPPLVLLVTIDTLRADRLSCYGGTAKTPAIDSLASRGLRFESAYSPCPLTGPSHASLLTGLEPPEHGVRDNGVALPAAAPTLAEVLAAAGYDTAAFVGAAPLDERLGFSRGFATYDGRFSTRPGSPRYAERNALEVTAAAARYVGGRREGTEGKPERPLFLWLHFFDPHAPYEPPPPFDRGKDRYDGEIAYVDSALREFLTLLELSGLLGPESLVVLASDHGEALGEHGEPTHGLLVHDATLRVPLVVAGHGVEPGVVREPVSLLDVAPTVAAHAGVSWPGPLSGRPLPARSGEAAASRDLYAESYFAYFRYRWAGQRALRGGPWKWVDGGPDRALYETVADPGETIDRAASNPDEARRLEERLAAAERSFAPAVSGERPGTVNLEALSYAGSPGSGREAASLPPEGNDKLPAVATRLPLLARLEEAVRRLDADDPASARDAAAAVVEADPGNPDARLALGRAERDLGRPGEPASYAAAEASLRRAISLRAADPAARNALIQTLALAGRDADAVAEADAAESAHAANAATAILAGEILSRPGSPVHDPAEAERRYRRALERDPENPVPRERLRSK